MSYEDDFEDVQELAPVELETLQDPDLPQEIGDPNEADDNVSGLYSKAVQILNGTPTLNDAASGEIIFDEHSGISKADQQDIIKNINQIMQSSKISVTPELFRIKAKKRGVTFPFFVNLFALLVLAGGVFISWMVFQSTETSITNPESAIKTGAQDIIEALKKEAEAELTRKNQEILSIQSNLEDINSKLTDLQENIDAEIESRRRELETQNAQALADERQRLLAAGASAEEIQLKMRDLQQQQESQFLAEINRVRAEAEAANQQTQQDLLAQKNSVSAKLTTAQEELKRTQADYEAKVSAQEKTISEAQARIQQLAAQKEKFDLVNDQITGYYRLIQTDIKAGNYTKAQGDLGDLRKYLAQPAVLGVPEINRRKDVELFVVESLESVVKNAETAAQPTTTQPTQEAKAITDIRALVLKADEAYRAGNKTSADSLYLQALQLIPEINQSHNYFIGKLNEVEQFRKAQVSALLDTAATQVKNKQYTEALATYGKVLGYLPTDKNTEQVLTEIKTTSVEVNTASTSAQDTKAANDRLKTANDLQTKGSYNEAITAYLSIMKSYPGSAAAGEAAVQIQTAIKAKDDAFSKLVTTNQQADLEKYQKEIDSLKTKIAEREKELAALQSSSNADLVKKTTALEKEISELKTTIGNLNTKISDRDREIAGLKAQNAADLGRKLSEAEKANAELKAAKADLEKQVADRDKQLATINASASDVQKALLEEQKKREDADNKAADYRKLMAEYSTYATQEDSVIRTGSMVEMALGKSYLDSFLSSDTVQTAFPGLLERIKRYDRAFESAGRESAVQDIMEILNLANGYRTKDEKIAFLQKRLAATAATDVTSVFIRSLINLLAS